MSGWGEAFDRATEGRRVEDMTETELVAVERLASELLDALDLLDGGA